MCMCSNIARMYCASISLRTVLFRIGTSHPGDFIDDKLSRAYYDIFLDCIACQGAIRVSRRNINQKCETDTEFDAFY